MRAGIEVEKRSPTERIGLEAGISSTQPHHEAFIQSARWVVRLQKRSPPERNVSVLAGISSRKPHLEPFIQSVCWVAP